MYTRPITAPPKHIVENGIPMFGNFNFPPEKLDIQKLKQPFSLMPLPNFLTKLRIRTNLCFSFVADEYVGTLEVMDANWFAFAEVNVWERKTNRKLPFRTLILRRHTIPRTVQQGICKSHQKKRYIHIEWNHLKEYFTVLCKLKGDKVRQDMFFHFFGSIAGSITSVIPSPTMRRCKAVHHAALSLEGSVVASTSSVSGGLGFFSIRRSFYPLRTHCHSITAQGVVAGKRIQFNLYISNQDFFTPDAYNENVLFINGEPTSLPPVNITHPYGLSREWVIQDTETMIDLSFFPITDTVRKKSLLILRTEYHTIYGTCGGTIYDKNGDSFPLKEFSAVAKKQYLRL